MAVIGIGTDIVECLRVAQMIERHGELFLQRVFTPREIEHCSSRKAATQHFAARWAAKQAVLKALGGGLRGGIRWTDVEVRQGHDNRPALALSGRARDVCEQCGAHRVLVSLSHCRTHATALVVAEDDD